MFDSDDSDDDAALLAMMDQVEQQNQTTSTMKIVFKYPSPEKVFSPTYSTHGKNWPWEHPSHVRYGTGSWEYNDDWCWEVNRWDFDLKASQEVPSPRTEKRLKETTLDDVDWRKRFDNMNVEVYCTMMEHYKKEAKSVE